MIRIYTDGAAQGNPGPGGYGVILKFNHHEKELSEGFRLTTNNRMELLAVICGLEAIKKMGINVTIYSDPKYVVDAVEKDGYGDGRKRISPKKQMPIYGNGIFPCIKNLNPNLFGLKDMPGILKMNAAMSWQYWPRKAEIYRQIIGMSKIRIMWWIEFSGIMYISLRN